MSLLNVSSQTAGPYLAIGFAALARADIASDAHGPVVTLEGRLLDGDGVAIADGAVEIWQAGPNGRYDDPAFRGFGRVLTDEQGGFRFRTVKPGAVPGPGGVMQAPHLAVTVFMRGSLRHLHSRVYFPDEPGNAADPLLARVPADRRATLVAQAIGADASHLRWDIRLQGEAETVFLDF